MKQLITGGARSGKSALAQARALEWQQQTDGKVVVIATATAEGQEMAQRIAHHQSRRPKNWQLLEAPRNLGDLLAQHSQPNTLIMVDCLTLWLSNELFGGDWPGAKEALLDTLPSLPGPLILIGNEVGQGVVPLGEGNRRFVDECGWLQQHLSPLMDRVTLTLAGLPLELKECP
ncbi:bifunctional adenosylcobinamide kinase/adenosylcobinamide-phosphate guanylyltransferase [Ferrimonas futtsuensis]|uniref:bifunctional adenosylcobinamide kinase/adenosylcobinamide-phosphate guanylyltransferase n=1 Tax=Ferrimonas futtsuensis TaxID=364764 RepID=UPI0003FA5741|nr:bifunctional adenosylcobinamide kinase/adenosylcobinamide-phosphate guanylyltransferase [Ferrimonas futtsuensis]